MIDTVSITIPESNFKILDHNKFSPCTSNLYKSPFIKITGKAPFKAVNNPTKKDIELHGYLPRLTLIKALRSGGLLRMIMTKNEKSGPQRKNNF